MTLEIRPRSDDPTRVDFYAAGELVTNVSATRVWNRGGRLTAQAVVIYDKSDARAAAGKSKSGRKSRQKSEPAAAAEPADPHEQHGEEHEE